ncbi:DnaJ-domain-containing protein [Peniophora sp. CONT]|nr:DnaJ-domain-containing protein [Peniophora sp. CONT]
MDYYSLLGLPRSSALSPAAIKSAYHAALLRHHPDKQKTSTERNYDVDLLRIAYQTLSDPILRASYDQSLSSSKPKANQRPADFVSLDDFEELDDAWTLQCRCSGTFRIDEVQLESGVHIVGCSSCSEVVWVGYEAVEGD